MTLIDLRPTETLRDQVRVLRRLRQDGIVLCARQVPAGVDTGEFVEVVHLGHRSWLVAVGDAKSVSPEGAEIARDVRGFLARRAPVTRHPGDLLAAANGLVHEAAGGEELVSVAVFVLDGARRTLRIANAGQIAPLAVGRGGGVVALEGHGPALGLLPDVDYHDAGPLRLAPGMVVLAVTDGVHEAVDADGHPFGRSGVGSALAAARARGPRAVVRRVLDDVAVHASPAEADDRTALAFTFR